MQWPLSMTAGPLMKRSYVLAVIALFGCEREAAPAPAVDEPWSEANVYYKAWTACDAFARSMGIENPGLMQGSPQQFGRTRLTEPAYGEPEQLFVLSYPSRTGRETWSHVDCETTADFRVRYYKIDGRVLKRPGGRN